MKKQPWSVCLIVAALLTACKSGPPPAAALPSLTPTMAPLGTLNPFHTATPTVYPPSPTHTPTLTPLPTATPTPFTYKVKESDDMFGIALRFGVSLPALKTANPTVNPRAMSVGTILIIPLTPSPSAAGTAAAESGNRQAPTPTPVLQVNRPPDCYPAGDGGEWCFLLVENPLSTPLENITGILRLVANDTQKVTEQTALMPLNLLPAHARLPLVAYFSGPLAPSFSASGEVTIAFPLPENDARYLPVSLADQQVQLAADRHSADGSGSLSLPAGGRAAQQVWVVAVAYSRAGAVAGMRKWEADKPLQPGETRPFMVTVYSLGPEIDKVELSVEAR